MRCDSDARVGWQCQIKDGNGLEESVVRIYQKMGMKSGEEMRCGWSESAAGRDEIIYCSGLDSGAQA